MNKAALVPMPCCAHLCSASPIFTGLLPSLPVATVVTPCMRYASFRLVAGLERSSKVCVWGSINPGATIRPCASMMRLAFCLRFFPMRTTLSPRMPMSTCWAGEPEPSRTEPLRIRRSRFCAHEGLARKRRSSADRILGIIAVSGKGAVRCLWAQSSLAGSFRTFCFPWSHGKWDVAHQDPLSHSSQKRA